MQSEILLHKIDDITLSSVTDIKQAALQIVNVVAAEAGYRAMALYILDKENALLERLAVSETGMIKACALEFKNVFYIDAIRLTEADNSIARCVRGKEKLVVTDLASLIQPAVNEQEINELTEKKQIQCSFIYPLVVRNEAIGSIVISFGKEEEAVSLDEREFMDSLTGVVGIAMDNILFYQRTQESNQRLKAFDRLKDEFVSVASHELRTPMTSIKSYLWMALAGKGGELNERQKYYIQRAYNSSTRLIKLVNDMLNVSRIESGRVALDLASVDLVQLSNGIVEELIMQSDELGVTILFDKQPTISPVLADADKIKEVLFNLLGNSLKFTPKGGTVSISFSMKDGFVETRIADTGVGVEVEDLFKMFQKFGVLPGTYTTNISAEKGTGLGLYICKSIVQLHEGDISVES